MTEDPSLQLCAHGQNQIVARLNSNIGVYLTKMSNELDKQAESGHSGARRLGQKTVHGLILRRISMKSSIGYKPF